MTTRTHEFKVWPEFFAKLVSGDKTFEARRDDRGFAVGDTLVLREWDPRACEDGPPGYTGNEIRMRVTYILRGPSFGVEAGFVVMAVRREDT